MATTIPTNPDNPTIEIILNSTEYIEFCAYKKQFIGYNFTFEEVYGKNMVTIKGRRDDFKLLGYTEE